MNLAGQQGVVLISVTLMGVILSLLIVGTLGVVADELELLRLHKDFLRARYVADAGAAVLLARVAEAGSGELPLVMPSVSVDGGQAIVRWVAEQGEVAVYHVVGRVGTATVTVRLVVEREAPHRLRAWTVLP